MSTGAKVFVLVPRDVLEDALRKARSLYVHVAKEDRSDAGPADECWAEFEALSEWLR